MISKVVNEYLVSTETLALAPAYHTEYDTIVFELHRTLAVRQKPIDIIKKSCIVNGLDYEGMQKAAIHKFGKIHKPPIPISLYYSIYAFPTHSPKNHDCHWIFPRYIKYILQDEKNKNHSTIRFQNELTLPLKVSTNMIIQQIKRTSYSMVSYNHLFLIDKLYND